MAWKINRERLMLLGWGPAILLQFAHPLVAAGIAEHSTAFNGMRAYLRRTRRTVEVMLMLTFGTPTQVEQATRDINAVHRRVHGRLAASEAGLPSGTPYTARDPALLCWVYATMLYMLPRAYQLYVGPLTAEERDSLCAEAQFGAPLLGIPEGQLPRNAAVLEEYIRAMLDGGAIVVDQTARTLARELLEPGWPLPARPLLWLAALPAVGLLPPTVRQAYGLPWGRRHQIALQATAWLCRRLLPLVPPAWRYWPAARAAQCRATMAQGGAEDRPSSGDRRTRRTTAQ